LGVPIIDKDHKFIDTINKVAIVKVAIVKKNNDDPEGVKEVLREMTNYALTHFKTEETYMIEFNYPQYQDHKDEHHDFAMKTIAYLDKVIKGDYQIANDILEDLKSWLVNHIQVTDRKYIDYFKRNSLK
jgi:hemerythrin